MGQQEKTVAEVLEAAASLIEPEGAWGQRGYQPRKGCFCALGAIATASGSGISGDWSARPMRLALCAVEWAFATEGPEGLGAVVDWNDAPERTQAEVVAKLREAAAVARERGL